MRLLLKSQWTVTKNLKPQSVGNEFINIANDWNNADSGISQWTNVNVNNLILTDTATRKKYLIQVTNGVLNTLELT